MKVLPILPMVPFLLGASPVNTGTTQNIVQDAIVAASEDNDIPLKILSGLCWVESNHNPKALNRFDGKTASYGLCQIKLATARSMGFKGSFKLLYNPIINAQYAAKYLRKQYLRYDKNWIKAISAYNGGKSVLSENSEYVNKVFKRVLEAQ
jgi:soluble lytic murein transglycosylase-like protein